MKQSVFKQPIHYPESSKQILAAILFVSIACCVFLIFFQPFGVNNYDPAEKISPGFVLAISLFGSTIFVAFILNEFVIRPILIKNFTTGKLILWLLWSLIFIGTASYFLYNVLGGWHDWNFASYFDFLKNLAVLGAIPLIIVIFYFRQRSMQQTIGTLKGAYRSVGNRSDLILFTADNQKDKFAVPISAILFLESQDNYVVLNYIEGASVRKHMLRSTLKRMEDELSETSVMKCHRSYLVNLDNVTSASGNAHYLNLALQGYSEKIPVSRSFTGAISEALDKPSK